MKLEDNILYDIINDELRSVIEDELADDVANTLIDIDSHQKQEPGDKKPETPKEEGRRLRIGLTSREANTRIHTLLGDALKRYEAEHKVDVRKVIAMDLFKSDIFINLVALLLLTSCLITNIVMYNDRVWEHALEIVLLTAWLVLNVYLKIVLKVAKLRRKSNRVLELMHYIQLNLMGDKFKVEGHNLDPPSSDLVPVYRDCQWVRLPTNLIVRGDVFKLRVNQLYPCDCRHILGTKDARGDDGGLVLDPVVHEENTTCKHVGGEEGAEKFVDGTFLALTDACTTYVNRFLYEQPRTETKRDSTYIWNYNDNYIFTNNINNKLIIVVVIVLNIAINLVWALLFDRIENLSFLLNSIRVWILLDFVGFDPISKLLELWGNMKLMSIFELYHEKSMARNLNPMRSFSSLSSIQSDSSYSSVSSSQIVNEITLKTQLNQLKRVLMEPLIDENSLVTLLSNITLLSFTDDAGILLNSNQSLQEISIITKDEADASKEGKEEFRAPEPPGSTQSHHSSTSSGSAEDTPGAKADPGAASDEPRSATPSLPSAPTKSASIDAADDEDDNLLILDIFNDINLYGKDNIRFISDYEKSRKNLLKPLVFSMSITSTIVPSINKRVLRRPSAPDAEGAEPNANSDLLLYNNYIDMLINSQLKGYTSCSCTLTNVLGIKKPYLKRYKLLKVIIVFSDMRAKEFNRNSLLEDDGHTVVQERSDKNDKISMIIYFYRDINKKVIQMLIKCNVNVINNYKLNYYNGDRINAVNSNIKRKVKELNIQWLSNGMFTFLYLYKPIAINDFNILLLLLPFITVYRVKAHDGEEAEPRRGKNVIIKRNKNVFMYLSKHNRLYYKYKGINMLKLAKLYKRGGPHEQGLSVGRDTILGSFIGETLNSYIKNSILLGRRRARAGMAGAKYDLPKEISNHINNLHEAGIRFVYFSKHNERKTKIIGSLLGLEISWNSMISLSATEKWVPLTRSSFINQEGNMVLPNGINNIRYHIENVDDIPLQVARAHAQVSLFYNCNYFNTNEMLSILNEYGENIMCVGSGLKSNNFYLFNNAHLAFSVSLNYTPICKFCKGGRTRTRRQALAGHQQGAHLPRAETRVQARLADHLAALPAADAAALQGGRAHAQIGDPNFIFDMLFELFREARSAYTNMQEALSFMLLSYYSLIWMYLLQQVLSLPFIMTVRRAHAQTLDISLITFVYIPVLSITLLSNPAMDGIMEHLPNKVPLNSQFTLKNYVGAAHAQVRTYSRLLIMGSFIVVIYYIHTHYTNKFMNDKYGLRNQFCSNFFYYPKIQCINDVRHYLATHAEGVSRDVCTILAQNYTSISFVLFLIIASLSWIQKYSYINLETFTNVNWLIAAVIILSVQIGVVAVKVTLMPVGDSRLVRMMAVNTGYTLLAAIPIVAIDQLIKFSIIKDKNTQQKFLQLLFSTRLGTYSPK